MQNLALLQWALATSPTISLTLYLKPDGSVRPIWVSPNVRSRLGRGASEYCQGNVWDECIHPEDRAAVFAARLRFRDSVTAASQPAQANTGVVGEITYRFRGEHNVDHPVRERLLAPPATMRVSSLNELADPGSLLLIGQVSLEPAAVPILPSGAASVQTAPESGDQVSLTSAQVDLASMAGEAKEWALLAEKTHALGNWEKREEFYRSILDAQTDCVCRYTADMQLRYANAAYCEYIGVPPDKVLEIDLRSLVSGRYRDYIYSQLSSLSPENPINSIEHSGVDPQGRKFWMQWTNRALFGPDGKVVEILGVGRNITEQKSLEQALAKRTLTERRDIGNQLHDGVGQHISAIGMLSASLENRLAAMNLPSEVEAVQELRRLVADARSQVRSLIRGLCFSEMDAESLPSAFSQLVKEIAMLSPLEVAVELPEDLAILDDQKATQVYQIARESVLNAMRHSEAAKAGIKLVLDDDLGRLTIRDNGKGIKRKPNSDGAGIQIMRYRAESMNGTFAIQSMEEGGTQVSVTFPYGSISRERRIPEA